MTKQTYPFSSTSVDYYFNASLSFLPQIVSPQHAVVVTDEHVYQLHKHRFSEYKTIVIPAGEQHKHQATVDSIIQQLIAFEADRKWTLIGIGGGVVTDITGYAASVYMRGIHFGFVATTVLAMVDASIGGKNGIDVGIYKNMVGVIKQPAFLLYDIDLLQTLPDAEWSNGFAEIIKHACIKDADLFELLKQHQLQDFQQNKTLLAELIERNVRIKTKVVQEDEFEKGDRKLLNYGHTLGHAIENTYQLMHGQAVAIGMVYAATISKHYLGFQQSHDLIQVLQQYALPTQGDFDLTKAFDILKMDKKRDKASINYVLLQQIGKGVVQSIPLNELETIIQTLNQ